MLMDPSPLIPTHGRLREEDYEYEDNLGYIARASIKKLAQSPQL
jgi:hypothetical protein